MERTHVDLIGPSTLGKQHKYLINVVEDHSGYMVVQPLQRKSDAGDALIAILNKLETAISTAHGHYYRTNQVQADWGGEFRNNKLQDELRQRGIVLKATIPNHSETNTIIERANRTILDMSRTSLVAA